MAILVIGNDKTKAIPVLGTGGSTPVVSPLNVTPSTSAQQFIPSGGTDGYNPVNVSAVTNAIDANITANNIVNGVTILGVTGTAPKMISGIIGINQNGVYNVVNTTTNTFVSQIGINVIPTGIVNITQDGTYNVANYGTAIVNTSGLPSGSPHITVEQGDLQVDSSSWEIEMQLERLINQLEKIEVYYFGNGNNDYAYLFPVFYDQYSSEVIPCNDYVLYNLFFDFSNSCLEDWGVTYNLYLGFVMPSGGNIEQGGIRAMVSKE